MCAAVAVMEGMEAAEALALTNRPNAYERGAGMGGYGGTCTCPDGKKYEVGDLSGAPRGTLACHMGQYDKAAINRKDGPWSGHKVTCAAKVDMNAAQKNAFVSTTCSQFQGDMGPSCLTRFRLRMNKCAMNQRA